MELVERIQKLRRERNAVILAHNYQLPEVQDIADYVGDSLGLSIQAARTPADVIVFCGVHFMAETAKIISPEKTVLIPDANAGCPMADMLTAAQLRELKAKHPGAKAICYVNTTAAVKAECDLCCTSANAERIVRKAFPDGEQVIFVPDQYLAAYVSSRTGRDFVIWKGFCPTHARILPEHIREQRRRHPGAEVIAHPECKPAVVELSDQALSTEGLCRYVQQSAAEEIIVGTELGIIHRLKKENPGKIFYPATELAICPNMKLTTLEKIAWSLEDMVHEVLVPAEVARQARVSIDKMLSL